MSRLPSPEQWQQLQGGAPTLLLSESGNLVEVVHVDGDVIPTPMDQLKKTPMLDIIIGESAVKVPAALMKKYHGEPCNERSREKYTKLPPNTRDEHIRARQAQGWRKFELQ